MVNNPEGFADLTHLIMDEIHERDLDIDFSLVVIKHLLAARFNKKANHLKFKLILMSATFNTELFSHYFSKSSIIEVETVESYKGVEENYKK